MNKQFFYFFLKRILPLKLILKLKEYYQFKYEIIISRPHKIIYPKIIANAVPVNFELEQWSDLRKFIRNQMIHKSNPLLNILNVGCGDGSITDQIIIPNTINEEEISAKKFFTNYNYYTFEYFDLDINKIIKEGSGRVYYSDNQDYRIIEANSRYKDYPTNCQKGHIKGDITNLKIKEEYKQYEGFFDTIISVAVLEHVNNPFRAASNIDFFLKEGGTVITIVPFSYPYHKDPEDYFRLSHIGVLNLFEQESEKVYEPIKWGYDCTRRRGGRIDINGAPIDNFGGWREHIDTYCEFIKTSKLNKRITYLSK